MEPFYCLIHRKSEAADLWVLEAQTESDALQEIERLKLGWRPFSRVELYRGERRIKILARAELGCA